MASEIEQMKQRSDAALIDRQYEHIKALEAENERLREEVRDTWNAARAADGQMKAFRILERLVDRVGYGRTADNPSLAALAELEEAQGEAGTPEILLGAKLDGAPRIRQILEDAAWTIRRGAIDDDLAGELDQLAALLEAGS